MSRMNCEQVKDQVAWCLARNRAARSDDNLLSLAVWANFYKTEFMHMIHQCCTYARLETPFNILGYNFTKKNMRGLPSSASISRVRRKLQNEDLKFLPEPGTTKNRKKAQLEVFEWALSDKDTL